MFCGVCGGCWPYGEQTEPVWGSAMEGQPSSMEHGLGLLLGQLGERVLEPSPSDLCLQLTLHSLQ